MTSWAAQYYLAGRMWPVGRRLESPALDMGPLVFVSQIDRVPT